MEQRHFCQASLQYVCLLQQVQERKKFEFVEPVITIRNFIRIQMKVHQFSFLPVAGFYVRLAHILSPRAWYSSRLQALHARSAIQNTKGAVWQSECIESLGTYLTWLYRPGAILTPRGIRRMRLWKGCLNWEMQWVLLRGISLISQRNYFVLPISCKTHYVYIFNLCSLNFNCRIQLIWEFAIKCIPDKGISI